MLAMSRPADTHKKKSVKLSISINISNIIWAALHFFQNTSAIAEILFLGDWVDHLVGHKHDSVSVLSLHCL